MNLYMDDDMADRFASQVAPQSRPHGGHAGRGVDVGRIRRPSLHSITEAMDNALKEVGEEAGPFVTEAARRILKRQEW